MKKNYAGQRKLSAIVNGIDNAVKKLSEQITNMLVKWNNGELMSKQQADSPVPQGPPLKGVSSARVLPNVHEALRQNAPMSKAPSTQPSLPKKAPPTTGEGMPAGFYRVEEPPRIGSEQTQPAPPPKLPASAPTTPAHPPRPPISALPQPVQEPPASTTLKHPLPQPAQQGPPNKQGRSKDFPRDQSGNPLVPMPAAPAVDLAKVGAPTRKGPPASFTPAPREVLAPRPLDSCAAAALPGQDVPMAYGQKPKIRHVKSPSDIDWDSSLKDQLEPQLSGGPDPKKKSFEELCVIRNRIPKMDDTGFQKIFPGQEQCILCVVQKNGSRHFIHLREAAAWIINAAHWFSVLQQPMMIVIWCRDWDEASKF